MNYPKIEKIKQTEIEITDKKHERNIINLRLAKWKTSLDVFKKVPLFGVSDGDYKNRMNAQYIINGFLYCAREKYSSHNQFLFILSSKGFLGFSILFLLLLAPFLWHKRNTSLKLLVIICAIFFLTEDVLARQQGLVFFVYFFSLFSKYGNRT